MFSGSAEGQVVMFFWTRDLEVCIIIYLENFLQKWNKN